MQQLGCVLAAAVHGASNTVVQFWDLPSFTEAIFRTELSAVAEEQVAAVEILFAGRSWRTAIVCAAQFGGQA